MKTTEEELGEIPVEKIAKEEGALMFLDSEVVAILKQERVGLAAAFVILEENLRILNQHF